MNNTYIFAAVALFLIALGVSVVCDHLNHVYEIQEKYEFLDKHPYLYGAEHDEVMRRYEKAKKLESETQESRIPKQQESSEKCKEKNK